jgi:peptidoglycan/xylan/chitin deacetylase (PgdA/CDA1 family)
MKKVYVLLYHRVGTPPPGTARRKLWVTPSLLALHVRFLRSRGYRFTTMSDALAAPSGRFACVTFDDGFRDVVTLGAPALRALGVPATLYAVTDEVGRHAVSFPDDAEAVGADMASWDELRAVRGSGWEIGSHSARHLRLASLPGEEQRALVRRSRDALADQLGAAPRSFAYPYGSYATETIRAVRDAGFDHALTTRRGVIDGRDDRFELPRVTIGGQHPVHAARLAKLLLVDLGVLPLGRVLGPRRGAPRA